MSQRVAIIGGSKEAIDIAHHLSGACVDCVLFDTKNYASPAELNAQRYAADTDWSQALAGCDIAIIAPHPFAFEWVLAVKDISIPQAAYCRAMWHPKNNWTQVKDAQAAADKLLSSGAKRPLVAIGRERLAPLLETGISGMQVRCKSAPLPDFHGKATPVLMRGPFKVAQEATYLRDNNIDCIVAHNAGGQGGYPKLEAAEQLGIPVILIDRPDIPWDVKFETIDALMEWLRTQGLDVHASHP